MQILQLTFAKIQKVLLLFIVLFWQFHVHAQQNGQYLISFQKNPSLIPLPPDFLTAIKNMEKIF